MSLHGVQRCLCCDAEFNNTGCLRGFRCDCNQGLDADCFGCMKCKKHCVCEGGPVEFNEKVRRKLLAAVHPLERPIAGAWFDATKGGTRK